MFLFWNLATLAVAQSNFILGDDVVDIVEDNSVNINILSNDEIPCPATYDLDISTLPSFGFAETTSNGSVLYTPMDGECAVTDSFYYQVSCGTDVSNPCLIVVNINCYTETVVANDDEATTKQGRTILINVLGNDESTCEIDTIIILDNPEYGQAIITEEFQLSYRNTDITCDVMDRITYAIVCGGVRDVASVEIKIDCEDLEFFTAMSPNDDGINDFFEIAGLDKYPNHSLSIINRHGVKVFSTKDYQNDWNGTWDGKDLSNGTYWYHFNDGKGEVKGGYFIINR